MSRVFCRFFVLIFVAALLFGTEAFAGDNLTSMFKSRQEATSFRRGCKDSSRKAAMGEILHRVSEYRRRPASAG